MTKRLLFMVLCLGEEGTKFLQRFGKRAAGHITPFYDSPLYGGVQ